MCWVSGRCHSGCVLVPGSAGPRDSWRSERRADERGAAAAPLLPRPRIPRVPRCSAGRHADTATHPPINHRSLSQRLGLQSAVLEFVTNQESGAGAMQNSASSQAERGFLFTTYRALSPENLTIYGLALELRMLVLERTTWCISMAHMHDTTE